MRRLFRALRGRPVILHYHIFKNSGSTLDDSLERSFEKLYRSVDSKYPMGTIPAGEIIRMIKEDKRVKIITSHCIRLPFPRIFGVKILPFVLVRHPVDRIVSVYEFEKRQANPGAYPRRQLAADSNLEEFVMRVGDVERGDCYNWHVRFFGNGGEYDGKPVTERMFQHACSVARSLPFVGVVDRFDESMVLAEYLYGRRRRMKELNLAYVAQNVTPGRPNSLQERLADLEGRVSKEAYHCAVEGNALDIRFYEYCSELLSQACRRVPSFEEKMAEFRKRCDALDSIRKKILREREAQHEKAEGQGRQVTS